jgi:succinate dehydrogenase / fumarate reductase membrane anchor subunit
MQKSMTSSSSGAANRAGASAFWQSRVTGVLLLVLVPYAIFVILHIAGRDQAGVKHALAHPWISLPALLLVVVGVWHMRVGMREILEDYVRGSTLRVLLLLSTLFCLFIVASAGYAVLRLGFGS